MLKSKQSGFYKYQNGICQQIKLQWKLFAFYTIAWTLTTILSLWVITWVNGESGLTKLSISRVYKAIIYNWNDEQRVSWYPNTGMASVFTSFTFSSPAIIFFSTYIITMVNRTINQEIKSGQFCFWSTLPLSRTKIYFSKIIAIILQVMFIYLLGMMIVLGFSAGAVDSKELIGAVILYGFEFFLFLLLLIAIYSTIFLVFLEKPSIAIIISSMVIVYIFATNMFVKLPTFWEPEIDPKKPAILVWQEIIYYISPQTLIVNTLQFKELTEFPELESITNELVKDIHLKYEATTGIITMLMMICLTSGLMTFNWWWFNKVDLNI